MNPTMTALSLAPEAYNITYPGNIALIGLGILLLVALSLFGIYNILNCVRTSEEKKSELAARATQDQLSTERYLAYARVREVEASAKRLQAEAALCVSQAAADEKRCSTEERRAAREKKA
jgi:hypothetical protein